jgi:hypothetical protein
MEWDEARTSVGFFVGWIPTTTERGNGQLDLATMEFGVRLSFKFTAHSSNKSGGTAISREHRASPLVVGAGNAST